MSKVTVVLKSGNAKTGAIPITLSERGTCPSSCSFLDNGCYALGWPLVKHWNDVPKRGVEWAELCAWVADLPEGTLWRHNTAGDLPNDNRTGKLDGRKVEALTAANDGRRGFTYTHTPHTREALQRQATAQHKAGKRPTADITAADHAAMRANLLTTSQANLQGFTINVSCDSLEEVDALMGTPGLPVVVVLPLLDKGTREPKITRTPGGRKVVTCPAQYIEARTCANCELCARPDRDYAIGFRAHGNGQKKANNVVAANALVRSNRA